MWNQVSTHGRVESADQFAPDWEAIMSPGGNGLLNPLDPLG